MRLADREKPSRSRGVLDHLHVGTARRCHRHGQRSRSITESRGQSPARRRWPGRHATRATGTPPSAAAPFTTSTSAVPDTGVPAIARSKGNRLPYQWRAHRCGMQPAPPRPATAERERLPQNRAFCAIGDDQTSPRHEAHTRQIRSLMLVSAHHTASQWLATASVRDPPICTPTRARRHNPAPAQIRRSGMGRQSSLTLMSARGAPGEIIARTTRRRISWCQPGALIAHPYGGRDRRSRTAVDGDLPG